MELRKVDILTENGNTSGRLSIGSAVVIIKDDTVLLVRGKGGTNFKFPGGHLKDTETLHEAAIREAREEVGTSVTIEDTEPIFYLFQLGDGDDVLLIHYLGKLHGEPKASTEIEEIRWVPIQELPENVFENVRVILQRFTELAV